MANYDLYKVNLTTNWPGSDRKGETPKASFTKYNDFLSAIGLDVAAIQQVVNHIGDEAPDPAIPFMTWIDTSVTPAVVRRRDRDNNTWIALGPALQVFGTAASLSADAVALNEDNLVNLTDMEAARENLGLGSAAEVDLPSGVTELGTAAGKNMPTGITEFGTVVERNVVESPDDPTPYRVPVSGWMGLGLPRVSEGQGFNSTPKGTGLTYVKNPTAGLSTEGYLLEMLSDDPEKFKQFFARLSDGAFLHRQKTSSGFSAWFELFDSGNCVTISNSYGVAWRFPDGKQICTVEQYFDLPGDSNWKTAGTGSYRELGAMATYPAPFVSAPTMFAISSADGATNRGGYCTYVGSRLTTHIGPGTIVRSPEPPGYGGGFVFYLGLIGRWK